MLFQEVGESEAVRLFQERCRFLIPLEAAQAHYGVTDASMLVNGHLWCAFRWAGLERKERGWGENRDLGNKTGILVTTW